MVSSTTAFGWLYSLIENTFALNSYTIRLSLKAYSSPNSLVLLLLIWSCLIEQLYSWWDQFCNQFSFLKSFKKIVKKSLQFVKQNTNFGKRMTYGICACMICDFIAQCVHRIFSPKLKKGCTRKDAWNASIYWC